MLFPAVLLAAVLCACMQGSNSLGTSGQETMQDGGSMSESALADQAAGAKDITGLRFVYDKYSGEEYYLNAFVEGMSENGGKATLIKRVGPMNYTGHEKEGEFTLSGQQAARLREILSGYDLEAWSQLPTRGSGVSPTRSLIVFHGEKILYNVMWSAVFPKTLPPQEDILYFELFNFFNDMVAAEPGWEEVRSENLKDPRENPAYYERTVTWFGNEVKLVPGTGTYYADGRYAEIDYEGREWWIMEGFTGRWKLDQEAPSIDPAYSLESASLTVHEDGTLELILDDEIWQGKVSGQRRYRDSFWIELKKEDGQRRSCEVDPEDYESYDRIHISCESDPYPEAQYMPIDVFLLKQ